MKIVHKVVAFLKTIKDNANTRKQSEQLERRIEMTNQHKAQLEAMSSSELVALYNNNVSEDKLIKKFSDKETAVKRILALLPVDSIFWSDSVAKVKITESVDAKNARKEKAVWPFGKKEETEWKDLSWDKKVELWHSELRCPHCGDKENGVTPAGLEGTAGGDNRSFCHMCGTEFMNETGKAYKSPAKSASRSEGIANSWKDLTVAEKRAQRDSVKVEGHGEYRSVKQAFEMLNLPINEHIKFRMMLKENKAATFQNNNKEYKFSIA